MDVSRSKDFTCTLSSRLEHFERWEIWRVELPVSEDLTVLRKCCHNNDRACSKKDLRDKYRSQSAALTKCHYQMAAVPVKLWPLGSSPVSKLST